MSLAEDVERRIPGGLMRVLGQRDGVRPLSMVDGFLCRPLVPEDSIYYTIAHGGAAQFEDAAFAGRYAAKGRPSYQPTLLLRVLLLAFHDNTPDMETEQRCRYDLR